MGDADQAEMNEPSWIKIEQWGKGVSYIGEIWVDGGHQGSGGLAVELGIDGDGRRMVGQD